MTLNCIVAFRFDVSKNHRASQRLLQEVTKRLRWHFVNVRGEIKSARGTSEEEEGDEQRRKEEGEDRRRDGRRRGGGRTGGDGRRRREERRRDERRRGGRGGGPPKMLSGRKVANSHNFCFQLVSPAFVVIVYQIIFIYIYPGLPPPLK